MGLSENVGYIPNEIAIVHRDNDQQNYWVKRGTQHFQTHPYSIIWFPKLDGWSLLSAVSSSFRHTQISYQIATNWLYIPLIISHITIVAVYPPFSKRFFQLHPTSSIVAPNGPAVIAAGALIFSLYSNYITIVFLIIYPIYIYISQILSHYIVHIAYHSYSCCQHTSILVCILIATIAHRIHVCYIW